MEWQAEQDLKCPDCGNPRDETMSDEDDPAAPRYKAEAWVCRACAEGSSASHTAREDAGGTPLHGWKWMINKVNGSSPAVRSNGRG